MKNLILKIFKSEISYILIFLSIYLGSFLSYKALVSFVIAFLLIVITSKYKNIFDKFPILYSFLYISIYIVSLKMQGIQYLVGFLLGTATSSFLLNNLFFSKKIKKLKDKEALKASFIVKIAIIAQILYSFNYFYNLIIQDVRGQNRLNQNLVTLSVGAYILITPLAQSLLKKLLSKKIDFVSYLNSVFIVNLLLSLGIFYKTFIEIGSLKVILPIALTYLSILLIILINQYINFKKLKFKRTLSTLAYIAIPGLFLLYYPWSIGNYISVIFSFLSLGVFLNTLFLNNKDTNLEVKILSTSNFAINLYLILFGIFNLSAQGIITKINIADLNYLIMLIFGAFFVMLLRDLKDAIKYNLIKKNLESIYSIIVMSIIGLIVFLILDLGGVESLSSFIMGTLSITLIKNIFEERSLDNSLSDIVYKYLESNLINLLTIISLGLVLVKI